MKKFIFQTMLLGGALMASCSDNIYDAPVHENYTKSFVELFGPVHPDQDWNMAELKSITVDPGTGTEIKVYAREGIAYKLVAHYTNVSEKMEVKFDAAKNVTDFMVDVNGEIKEAKNGDFVDFSGAISRYYNPGTNNSSITFEVFQDYKVFSIDEIIPFIGQLPEGNSLLTAQKDGEKQNIHNNFFAKSRATLDDQPEEIVIYPVYWNAAFKHELGIYIKNADGSIAEHIPFWRNKDTKNSNAVQMSIEQDFNGVTKNTWVSPINHWGGGSSKPELSIKIDSKTATYIDKIRSKGIKIKIPKGVVYGFYINVWYTNTDYSKAPSITYYSEGQYNKRMDGTDENKGGHAAYFQTTVQDQDGNSYTQTFMGFEDMNLYGAQQTYTPDEDFNDLMFILNPAPYIITQTENSWIVAAEDLGTEDDYDFNDMVISVKNKGYNVDTKKSTVEVQGLAAGGTLPIYLMYGDQIVGGKEFHEAFWNRTATAGVYPMINTRTAGSMGEKYEIKVDGFFSLASYLANNMGGFKLRVENKNTEVITPPSVGEAPQMICVKHTWAWPTERTYIHDAYPGFTSAVGDKSKWGDQYTDGTWINNCNEKLVLRNSN